MEFIEHNKDWNLKDLWQKSRPGKYFDVKKNLLNKLTYDIKVKLTGIPFFCHCGCDCGLRCKIHDEKCSEAWDTDYPCDLPEGHIGEHSNNFARS